MITTEIPTWEDPPAMPKSNYRASGLVLRPKADIQSHRAEPLCVILITHEVKLPKIACG